MKFQPFAASSFTVVFDWVNINCRGAQLCAPTIVKSAIANGWIFLNIMALVVPIALGLKSEQVWSTTATLSNQLPEDRHKYDLLASTDSPSVIPNLDYLDPKLSSSFFITADSYFIPVDVLPNNGLDAFSSYTLLDFYSPKQEISILNLESNPLSEFPKFPEPNWQDRIFRF